MYSYDLDFPVLVTWRPTLFATVTAKGSTKLGPRELKEIDREAVEPTQAAALEAVLDEILLY